MSKRGLSPSDFSKQDILAEHDKNERLFKVLTSISREEKENYNLLLQNLQDVNSSEEYTANQKGKALEEIVTFLLESSSIFTVHENLRNNSNEIDQLIKINSRGRKYRQEGFLFFSDDMLLSECKNYNKKISVSWVGKFASLLISTNNQIGLLFSYHGFSGKDWTDGKGLCKKLYLSQVGDKKIIIVDINIHDFIKIKNGSNLLTLIEAKVDELKTSVKYEHFITMHPAENS